MPDSPSRPKPVRMRLDFWPTPELVHSVRTTVSALCADLIDEPDMISRLAMATHELLENALKYSADGSSAISLEMTVDGPVARAKLRLVNPASPEHIERVNALLSAIAEAPSPFELYQKAMRKTSQEAEGSGLGLLRICVEGEMRLRCAAEDGVLEIIAETESRREPPTLRQPPSNG